MRKRNVQILFRLTEEEAEHLNELVRKSGRSKEAFLREMVRGYQLCEKPDPEFYKMMRELSAIGNRINQLAVKAELSDISGRLKIIRKEVRMCEGIAARSDTLKDKLQTIRADENEQRRKELMKNEHRRRSGRTNRPNELGGL